MMVEVQAAVSNVAASAAALIEVGFIAVGVFRFLALCGFCLRGAGCTGRCFGLCGGIRVLSLVRMRCPCAGRRLNTKDITRMPAQT
jgi:hypothetical protein